MITDITVVSMMGGPSIELVPHWLAHYRALGLNRFVVGVDDETSEYKQRLAENGVTPIFYLGRYSPPHDADFRYRLSAAVTGDWIVQVDLDELVVFDRPLDVLLNDCRTNNYRAVRGRFIDHLQVEGQLAAVQAVPSLWQQFPLMYPVTERVRRGWTAKVVLRHRSFPVTLGNHLLDGANVSDYHPDWQETHHFRWTAATVPSMRYLLEVWPECPWRYEYDSVLNFLGDPPRFDLDKLRMLAPFIEPTDTLLGQSSFFANRSCEVRSAL